MRGILTEVEVGRKNVALGIGLFLVLGVVVGVPLTIDFFGGTVLTPDGYQTWKVVHGYGVFLAFINYFFGVSIDRLRLTRQQKELSSWSILIAGLCGGVVRMALVLMSELGRFGIYASLGETAAITIGTIVFVLGQIRGAAADIRAGTPQVVRGNKWRERSATMG